MSIPINVGVATGEPMPTHVGAANEIVGVTTGDHVGVANEGTAKVGVATYESAQMGVARVPGVAALVEFIKAHRWVWEKQVIKFFSQEWWSHMPVQVRP